MIAEFLKAELHSSRFREGSLKALSILGFGEELLENPDIEDPDQNKKRERVLGLCRGWPNKELFTKFPEDTRWFRVNISQEELGESYRLKSSSTMSDQERLISETSNKLKSGTEVKNINPKLIGEIQAKILANQELPPIILVAQDLNGKFVLIEGHSRSVAYCSVDKKYSYKAIPAIIGISKSMDDWDYF